MQTKDDAVTSEETPKKRRTTRAAAAASEPEPAKKPAKSRARAKAGDEPSEEKPEPKAKAAKAEKSEPKAEAEAKAEPAKRRTTRARKGEAAEERAEARPEPRPEPKAEPRPEPKAEARPEPKPEPKAEARPEPKAEARPEPRPEPRAEAPAPAPQQQGQAQQQGHQQNQQGGGQQQNQQGGGHQRHQRPDRHHRHRHERGGQGQGGQQQQGGGQQQAQGPQQGGHQQHQQQGQGGGQQGQNQQGQNQQGQGGGRRRRRRGRGGGGQLGQPGNLPNPGLEAQLQPVQGLLELDDRGFGKLRRPDKNFLASDQDADVPKAIVDRYRLRPGALVNASVLVRNGKPVVHRIDKVEGVNPEEAQNRLSFMNLTSVDPERRIVLETTSGELLTRAIDIIAPIGFGTRGLIVAPPKTGKTIILQKIAKAILTNFPKAKLMVLLVDERPEEVTDFKRSIGAEVFGSSSDRPAHEHLRLAELVMERARRLVEAGDDVVVLLDSITRLARAYNKEIESSGRTMSGGVDSRALERPKRLFGAARNTEEAGSLTIIGTALVDTGSRMDEVIFEEFKGTGNMEIVLDRQLAERRLFPAVNVNNSGTRKEEKLFSQKENEKIRKLRAYLSALRPVEAMEKLLSRLRDFRSNAEFFDAL